MSLDNPRLHLSNASSPELAHHPNAYITFRSIKTALKFEFLLLKELKHPYIVNMYDFFEDDEYFYLVLDFCEGKELFDMIVKLDGYAEKDAREVVRRLADALVSA